MRVWGLEGFGLRVQGLGGCGFSAFRLEGLGVRVVGLGFEGV